MEFSSEELATIRAALQFGLDLSVVCYPFAPAATYSNGNDELNAQRSELAKQLIEKLSIKQTKATPVIVEVDGGLVRDIFSDGTFRIVVADRDKYSDEPLLVSYRLTEPSPLAELPADIRELYQKGKTGHLDEE